MQDTPHAPSLLPAGKKWKLVWADEFDGDTLDRTKWDFRLHLMQHRHETFIGEQGIELDGRSNLVFKLTKRDGHFFSSHLQTGSNYMDRPGEAYGKFTWPIARFATPRFMHKYGYYECRCKLQAQPEAWWSAFWLQSPEIGSTPDPVRSGVEVDIMECFHPGKICHNNHWNGYGADHQHAGSGEHDLAETPDGFHCFGVDWSRDGYTFYVDGKESWRVGGPVSDREQFILISTECHGYRQGNQPAKTLETADLSDRFVVDHIRVFDERSN